MQIMATTSFSVTVVCMYVRMCVYACLRVMQVCMCVPVQHHNPRLAVALDTRGCKDRTPAHTQA